MACWFGFCLFVSLGFIGEIGDFLQSTDDSVWTCGSSAGLVSGELELVGLRSMDLDESERSTGWLEGKLWKEELARDVFDEL